MLDSDIPTADHPNAIVLTDHTGAPLLGKDGKPLLAWNLVHQNAADALANLAAEPAARDDIVGEGGIPPLVLLLEVDGRNTRQFAATALARLSKDHEATQLAVARAGAIASLVALLDDSEGSDAQEAAAGAILALAESPANRLTIVDSGGIGYLVMLLGSQDSHRDLADPPAYFVPLFLVAVLAHVLVERRRLGAAAWIMDDIQGAEEGPGDENLGPAQPTPSHQQQIRSSHID